MKLRNTLLLVFFVLSGIILGGLIAKLAEGVSWLGWLSYGESVALGMNADGSGALVLDLIIVKIALGVQFKVTVAQIIGIVLSLLGYAAIARKIK